ncbi:phosphoadenylylsulfate reductase (thioredoxin) [Geothermobacter ehrlichii]|uniref:Adenosine 5'-phosphosulfate reductase n=2 Tax=Geothermobacter ehrlichii TaxID=213224 RepID=A0A5D3WKD1_9BACT|nr:phosphoadenylylsulfate reductase (thioredoxin) [Geothermobacter ehrlichii]
MSSTAARIDEDHILSAEKILRQGLERAGGRVALACSFSIEDVTVIDLAHRAGLELGVFAIDTGRLPEETYIAAESVAQRYDLQIDWYFPRAEAVERLQRDKGLFSFRESLENRHQCCAVRKVEPLRRALAELSGWVTGLRRLQSVTRQDLHPIEIDRAHGGLLKINPLCDWNHDQVRDYAESRRIPVHPLHRRGYPSIGCAPCTRAVAKGEDIRAGRWWWESPEHKECGLHRQEAKSGQE